MNLPSSLIREFGSLVSQSRGGGSSEHTVRGIVQTVDLTNRTAEVIFDGSNVRTPVSMAMDASPGDRVLVMLKNHRAVITGNTSAPATARNEYSHYTEYGLIIGLLDDNGDPVGTYMTMKDGAVNLHDATPVPAVSAPMLTGRNLLARGTVEINNITVYSGVSKQLMIHIHTIDVPNNYLIVGLSMINVIITDEPQHYAVPILCGYTILPNAGIQIRLATTSDEPTPLTTVKVTFEWIAMPVTWPTAQHTQTFDEDDL